MPSKWVPTPRAWPWMCAFTGTSSPENGPYVEFDASRPYIDQRDGRQGRMYWAFSDARAAIMDDSGPFRVLVEEVVAQRTQELERKVESLEAELAKSQAHVIAESVSKALYDPSFLKDAARALEAE